MSRELSVVVVAFHSARVIRACLEACRGLHVVVVDNASSDETARLSAGYPDVELIVNPRNVGFAEAVNQAVRQADSRFILLLNPDVRLLTPIDPLVEACRMPGVGLACGQLLDSAGRPQRGFGVRRLPTPGALLFEILGLNRLFPWNPVNRRYRALDLDLSRDADVEQPAGAFLLFRREVWEQLGGFDVQFFPIWFEDVDFCKRALDSGWKIRSVAGVLASHVGGDSISQVEWAAREGYWYGSLLRYASKHFRCSSFRVLSAATVLGSAGRAIFAMLQRRTLRPWLVYWRVIHSTLPGRAQGRVRAPALRSVSAEGSNVRKKERATNSKR